MDETITTTVEFKSNLQPVKGAYREDKAFLESVHDIFALETMQKAGFTLSPLQQQEYRNASVHCAYAPKGDYPFGTITTNTGEQSVVCRCTNTGCRLFASCRPDYNPSELDVLDENDAVSKDLTDFDNSWQFDVVQKLDVIHSDPIAAIKLYHAPAIKQELHLAEDQRPEGSGITGPDDTASKEPEPQASIQSPQTQIGEGFVSHDATFESFTEVSQQDIISLAPSERTIVNAGPGTGKTWTLIEKIKYMMTNCEMDPANILVICFSRAAVEVVRNRLEAAANRDELPLNWHQIDVRTFDSFATYFLAWIQENLPQLLPKHFSLEALSYDDRIKSATTILDTKAELMVSYEHIIVDEVQDLVGVRAQLVLSILKGLSTSCGFTLLGDSCQALYDYLAVNDSSIMSSEQFYKELFHTYKEANLYSLSHNYRQGDDFGEFSIPYRKAILSEDPQSRTLEAKRLDDSLSVSNVNLKKMTQHDISSYTKNGTLGILSRTNGQALQISSWLRSEGIQHILQRPAQSQEMSSWIVRILESAETSVIDQSEFSKLFAELYPENASNSNRYWDALISTQIDQSKNHYEIEDIIKGILQNARNPLLFEDPTNRSNTITVSNIHRAKGREFDAVLVLQDVLENMADEDKNDLLEHKVCYVALTRPKKRVEKILLKPQYIYISKDVTRRCFKAGGFGNRRYISHFEVGDSYDFNARSFARTGSLQEYIKSLKENTRLKLIKCPEGTKSYVVYKIVPEDDENTILGYTTSSFANSMDWAIRRVFDTTHCTAYKYYPNIFGEIYLDGLTTCISSSDIGIEGAKQFGGMYIWYGLSISGFAQMEKDRY